MIISSGGCKFKPGRLSVNRITVGISGIVGKPMIGINGHLGGDLRGHIGIVN